MAPTETPHSSAPSPNSPWNESLHRTISDISFELMAHQTLINNNCDNNNNKDMKENRETDIHEVLPAISEVEEAKCECCGMSEECTPKYVRKVRDNNCGRMVCGLCSEAVEEEMAKNGGRREEALRAHVRACAGFNRVGRAYPVLCQAEAMREILRNRRAKSLSPRDKGGTHVNCINSGRKCGIISRSSSCIPALTKEMRGWKAERD